MYTKKPTRLLTAGTDAKTVKGEKYGYTTFIMYMSPFRDNSLGKNVCSHATTACIAACLFDSGRGGLFPPVKIARRNKTEFFLRNRQEFFAMLVKELTKIAKKYPHDRVAVRLNGTSDIAWEKFKIADGLNIMEMFPTIQFYDYTKNHTRFDRELPKNYHLTFSRSETNEEKSLELLARGVNVAMVFDKVPQTYKGFKVISGDDSDLRFTDESGVIVGLKYKKLTSRGANNAAQMDTGFIINHKLIA